MSKKTRAFKNKKSITPATIVIVLILALAYFAWNHFFADPPLAAEGEAVVHFIDVGQGDGALIATDAGYVMIDCGPNSSAEKTLAYVQRYTSELEYLVLTHAHEDHIGGADEILRNISVKNVLMTAYSTNTSTYTRVLDAIEESGAAVHEAEPGMEFSVGTSKFKVLGPIEAAEDDLNNTSIVLKLTAGGVRVMFTGDAERDEEDTLLARWSKGELRAEILKVGHHGSSTSSSAAFMEAVSPSAAVISCAKDNEYGHPHRETMTAFENLGLYIYRTDVSGTVIATLRDGKISWDTDS